MPGGFTRVHRHVSATSDDSSPQTATPELSLAPGGYSSTQPLTMSDATSGATIYYSIDGSFPSTSSPTYSGPIALSKSLTVAAYATAPGYAASDWILATYFIGTAPDSFVYNVAGTGFWGLEGDGGPATQAILNQPQGTAVDKSGNVYIADTRNQIIRRVDATTGVITTIAGTGVVGSSGDGGPAIDAQLNWPTSLAVDSAGDLYICDTYNNAIRKIDHASGVITTYAGSLFGPSGIAFDTNDNLYVVSSNRVFEIDAKTQTANAVAGSGAWGTAGDGGPALQASLSSPEGVAVDSAGNLYIADTFNGAVRYVNRSTGLMTTVAGKLGFPFGYSGDGGPAVGAQFSLPNSIAIDSNGDLWIADEYNWRIRKVTLVTGIVNTAVGNGQACYSTGGDGSPATFTDVCESTGLSFDQAGNLYFADFGNSHIKKVTAPAPPPTKYTAAPQFGVAGGTYVNPQDVPITDGTPGATVYLLFGQSASTPLTMSQSYHGDLEVDGGMTISAIAVAPGYLPSVVSSAAYKITEPPKSIITTVVGSGSAGFAGAGGPATSAELGSYQLSPAIDKAGNIYVSDRANNVVWKADSATHTISIVAGTGTPGYTGDGGPAVTATLNQPTGVTVDDAGNLYIADARNNVIREVFAADGTIKTVAGDGTTGSFGSLGDGGQATAAHLNSPEGVALDKNSNLYIADTEDCTIRRVNASTGIIQTVAGNGICFFSPPDGSLATAVSLDLVMGVAVHAGNIYIAEYVSGKILKVDGVSHTLSTVAGNGNAGTSGDGLPATQAEIDADAIAIDSHGNIYTDGLGEIRKIDATTGIITRIAGMGYGGLQGNGIPALTATVCPYNGAGIAVDSAGNLYFGDACVYGIRKVIFPGPAAKPVIHLAAGSYNGPQSVKISASPANAAIYYVLDGSTPDTGSTLYTGPIVVGTSETLNAVAVAPGFITSPVASAAYTITPVAPTIQWSKPPAITYGAALDATQLDATSNAPGSFVYSPPAGTVLGKGTHTLTATFTPDVDSGYTSATTSVSLVVNQATPAISWAMPASITYGTALSATQLNATSPVTGTFIYTPAAGTVPGVGSQTLSVALAPGDATDYAGASDTVTLVVNKATPVNTLASSSGTSFVSDSVTFTATLTEPFGSPSGTVTFMDGITQLGSGTVTGGAAMFTTSSLAVGSHTITAVYSGDGSFNAVNSATVSQTVEDFTFAPPSGGSTSATVQPGGTAKYKLSVTPPNGGKTASAVTLSVTGLPTGATATFNPGSVAANSGPTNVTLSIAVPAQSAGAQTASRRLPLALGLLVLPLLGIRRKRPAARNFFLALVAIVGASATAALTACGSNAHTTPPQPQSYTLTVTATAGTLTHSTKLTLTVE